MPIGFTNRFTAGEISSDGQDRVDIQPVNAGCEEATNLVVRIAGPLAKRRGFWWLGEVADQTKGARLVPFRRSTDNALMLEFGDLTVRVWSADGSPLLNGGVQVQFDSPYAEAALPNLRYKQVVDVIYFRTSDGLAPQSLSRISDIDWSFATETFPNGPWLAANEDKTVTINAVGTDDVDANAHSGAGSILAGEAVTLNASSAIFNPGHVGGSWRLLQGDGGTSTWSWYADITGVPNNAYVLSNGHVYACKATGGADGPPNGATNPPVQLSGDQSDGYNLWTYRHDGAGVVLITGYVSPTEVTGTVVNTIPLKSGVNTTFWAEGAYSPYRGWPRAWPEMVEERLANGATAANLDFVDLTGTADFKPTSETFSPGLGTGLVVDTDAMRRRLDGGEEVIWLKMSTFLIAGTPGGEHVISGGLFGSPLAPSTIVCRQISDYGAEDVLPVRGNKGLYWVTLGGQTIRQMKIDLQQTDQGDDCTVLAQHIAQRTFKQLAWVKQPDYALWARLADGGVAVMTAHDEQQVRGWTRQALPGGFFCEDLMVLPGPGRFDTLWMVVSRTVGETSQRFVVMQSQASDGLFIDFAQLYEGAPTAVIGDLGFLAGDTARIMANGVQQQDQVVSEGGTVNVPAGTTAAQVGLGYCTRFKSLKLATMLDGTINERKRITGAIVNLKCVRATAMIDGQARGELVNTRRSTDLPGPVPRAHIQQCNFPSDASRDPRVVVEEDTAYDFVIYSLRPQSAPGG